jgi:hypothetical protein
MVGHSAGSTPRASNQKDGLPRRLTAVIGIYKSLELYFSEPLSRSWFTRPNTGPLFGGSRPVDIAIDGGLPQILAVRTYLDALRGGA